MGSSIISITFAAHTQVKICPHPPPSQSTVLVWSIIYFHTFGTNVWKGCPAYFNMSQKPWDSSDANGNPLPSCDNSADPTQTKLGTVGNCCSSLACPFALTCSEVSTTLSSPGFLEATQLLAVSRAWKCQADKTACCSFLLSSLSCFIPTSVTTAPHVNSSEEFPECFALTTALRPPAFSADLANY